MARFTPIDGWPGSILYDAAHGRLYCAAPRGLIPEAPYNMGALRPPSNEEQRAWGPGVVPRMVVDVTEMDDLSRQIRRRSLCVAPWNAYLVLRLPTNTVVVAYRVSEEMPCLDQLGAGQVAIASGYDVAGWSARVVRHYGGERWHFSPPSYEPLPWSDPVTSQHAV